MASNYIDDFTDRELVLLISRLDCSVQLSKIFDLLLVCCMYNNDFVEIVLNNGKR